MGGKRQLVIRQIRVLRGGKRQGSKVEEEGADQIRKEKKISKGAAMPMAAQIFGYFFWERTWRDIFRTVSHLQSGPTGERRQRLSESSPIGEERMPSGRLSAPSGEAPTGDISCPKPANATSSQC